MKNHFHSKTEKILGLALLTALTVCAQTHAEGTVEAGFKNPPNSAKPVCIQSAYAIKTI